MDTANARPWQRATVLAGNWPSAACGTICSDLWGASRFDTSRLDKERRSVSHIARVNTTVFRNVIWTVKANSDDASSAAASGSESTIIQTHSAAAADDDDGDMRRYV